MPPDNSNPTIGPSASKMVSVVWFALPISTEWFWSAPLALLNSNTSSSAPSNMPSAASAISKVAEVSAVAMVISRGNAELGVVARSANSAVSSTRPTVKVMAEVLAGSVPVLLMVMVRVSPSRPE